MVNMIVRVQKLGKKNRQQLSVMNGPLKKTPPTSYKSDKYNENIYVASKNNQPKINITVQKIFNR